MKRAILVMACIFSMSMAAVAGVEYPIQVNQLPAEAQTFIKTYFPKTKVAYVKKEQKEFYDEYELVFVNGNKVEFDHNGAWKEVKCRDCAVPADIVPAQIADFVKENFPQTQIVKIERDRRSWEVKLSNRLEIEFDSQFNVIDIDD